MFLIDNFNKKKIINEATGEQDMGETTEQDAGFGGNGNDMHAALQAASGQDDMSEMGGDPNAMGGEDPNGEMGGDPNAMGGGVGTTGGMDNPQPETDEVTKKKKLFSEYKKLYYAMEDTLEAQSLIPYNHLSLDCQKIYNFTEEKLQDNFEKIKLIMTEKFSTLDYATLLTLFNYIKISLKNYADLLRYFAESDIDNEKN